MQTKIKSINEKLDYLYSLNDDSFDDEIIELEAELKCIYWDIDARIY